MQFTENWRANSCEEDAAFFFLKVTLIEEAQLCCKSVDVEGVLTAVFSKGKAPLGFLGRLEPLAFPKKVQPRLTGLQQ